MELLLERVTKSFGNTQVLKDISFTARSGRAMGFLGRNGAGKTTTIRILMDVFAKDGGSISIDGNEYKKSDFKVGYLPEERGMYANETLITQLTYFGELKGMNRTNAKKAAKYWLERLELIESEKKLLNTLSKGNQQKVQIIQALINDPQIIVLDEPFSGLDPVNSRALKDIVIEEINKDKIVVFSSHQMAYVEEFCDDIALISNGEILVSGDLGEIKKDRGLNKLRINSISHKEELQNLIDKNEHIDATEDQRSIIASFKSPYTQNDLLRDVLNKNIEISEFSAYEPSLNDIFIESVEANE